MRHLIIICMSIATAVVCASCSKEVSLDVKSLELDIQTITLKVDEEAPIHVTVKPEYAINREIEWKSSNPRVAAIEADQIVALSPGRATITAKAKSTGVTTTCEVVVEPFEMKAVDLGLSVLWAECNVGATKPTDFGDYYAWGETEPYYVEGYANWDIPEAKWKRNKGNGYSPATYKYAMEDSNFRGEYIYTKYNLEDGLTVLEPSDDVAHVKYGGKWRMPTIDEIQELLDACDVKVLPEDKVNGLLVFSKATNNSIFIPFAGERRERQLYNNNFYCMYWSSCLDFHNLAHALVANDIYHPFFYQRNQRYYGMPIRPVMDR